MSGLSAADRSAIGELHGRWLAEERAGRARTVLDFCDDDVIWLPPDGLALRGKEAVARWLDGAQLRVRSWHVSNLRIEGSGAIAFKTADYATEHEDEEGSAAGRVEGTHVWVLRKSAGGTWRVAVVAWTISRAE